MTDGASAILQPQLVCQQGNEFGIGGLALAVIHGIAEERVDRIQIAPIPCDFDRVANGTFHCVVRTNRYTLNYLDQNELFSATFFDPGYKPALQFCGTHSGKDCDKAQRTGLQPVLLEGTTSFAQARRVLICRKRYTAMLQSEGFLEPETYEKWYGKDPMHREFVGEVLAYYERMH